MTSGQREKVILILLACSLLTSPICSMTIFSPSQAWAQNMGGSTIPDFNFAAVGDTSCNTATSAIVSMIIKYDPERVLHLGDYSYKDGADCLYPIIRPIEDKMLDPTTIVMGNHETADGRSTRLTEEGRADLLRHFHLTEETTFYSWSYQDVHFLVMDTEKLYKEGSRQHNFVKEDLRQANMNQSVDWIVVYFHRNMYGESSTNPALSDLKSIYQPLFDSYGVDLVLQGHVHNYQRTVPIEYVHDSKPENLSSYENPSGQIYVIVGTGGRNLVNSVSHAGYMAKTDTSHYGFLNVEIVDNGTKMKATFYDISDQIIDQFTITKQESGLPVNMRSLVITDFTDNSVIVDPRAGEKYVMTFYGSVNSDLAKQYFAILQLEDKNGTAIAIATLRGNLTNEGDFSVPFSWSPNNPGMFRFKLFLWDSAEGPNPLSYTSENELVVLPNVK